MGTITTFHDHFLTIVDLFNRSFFIIVDRIIILIVDIDRRLWMSIVLLYKRINSGCFKLVK